MGGKILPEKLARHIEAASYPNRKMIYFFSAAFVFGAWLLQQQADLPDLQAAVLLLPLLALWRVAAHVGGRSGRGLAAVSALASFVAMGFFWSAAFAQWKLADHLDVAWEGRDVEISGVVAELPQDFRFGRRFVLDVAQVFTPEARLPHHLSVVWYGTGTGAWQALRAGQVWRMTLRLHRPHGNRNPGGFDAEAWQLEHNIRAAGYVRNAPAPRLLSDAPWRPGYLTEHLREILRDRLAAALGERPYAGVILALAIGEQRAIPAGQWQVFTRTGVGHLLSVSGLHITMLASLVFLLVSRFWRLHAGWMLRLPAVRAATLAGLLAALGYAMLSGFAVPAQRTVYMLAVVAAALWFGWVSRRSAVLALAAVVVILLDPMAAISAGFWLSFGAVAIILLAGNGRMQPPGWVPGWARTQWAVTLALIPLTLAMFQQISLVSPLANAFAIPVVSLAVVPLSILAALVPWDPIAHLAHGILSVCMWPLEQLAQLPGAIWQQHAPPGWSVPVALIGAVWMLMPRGFPARWVGTGFFLPLFLSLPEKPAAGELWLTVLDVGQGLSAVLHTREHTLVFDSGPAVAERIDAGSRVVVPYLRHAGVRRLDTLVISHGDLDHSGGALSILEAMPVERLYASLPPLHPILQAARDAQTCHAGQRWNWDDVEFEFLHPAENQPDAGIKDNDRSCVLRVTGQHGVVLLPADIERRSEEQLLKSHPGKLKSSILLAPHHGSRTSSTSAFLHAVAPEFIVIPVGHHNRFGHPHPSVSARYRNLQSRVFRTDVDGAILIRIAGSGIEAQGWRDVERRYWHDPSSGTEQAW